MPVLYNPARTCVILRLWVDDGRRFGMGRLRANRGRAPAECRLRAAWAD